jgi:hypothetical protein
MKINMKIDTEIIPILVAITTMNFNKCRCKLKDKAAFKERIN